MINLVKYLAVAMIFLFLKNSYAVSDISIPLEICEYIGASKSRCNARDTNAWQMDLNSDGVKELILSYGGGSCGSQYYVYSKNGERGWSLIGNWCGCDDGVAKLLPTQSNGYRNIYTCGVSGYFDGRKYVGNAEEDEQDFRFLCKYHKKMILELNSSINIYLHDSANRNWPPLTRLKYWVENFKIEYNLKEHESKWSNLGCIKYEKFPN